MIADDVTKVNKDVMINSVKLRSKRTRIERSLASAANRRSLLTFNKAVSVLRSEWKPDWNLSNKLVHTEISHQLLEINFKNNWDTKGNLEIGL